MGSTEEQRGTPIPEAHVDLRMCSWLPTAVVSWAPTPSPQAVTHLEHEGRLAGVLRPHVQAAGAWHVGRGQAAHRQEHAHLVQGLGIRVNREKPCEASGNHGNTGACTRRGNGLTSRSEERWILTSSQ